MYSVPKGRRIVGMQLPIQTLTPALAEPWESTATIDDLAAVARTADRAGIDYLGVCDHVALPEPYATTMGTQWFDPVSTLGWLAAQTSATMLLTHVYVLPYRHPRLAAKQFATLDALSGGRLICGIGAGHVDGEFELLGVDFAGRGRRVADGVPELRELLAAEFVDGYGARPRPVQQPRPPIWIAGSTPAAIRRAGTLADGWLPQSPASQAMVDLLLRAHAAAQRDDDLVIGHITPTIHVGDPRRELGPRTLVGTGEDLAAQLLTGVPEAVNQLQVRFRAQSCAEVCEQIEVFSQKVMPILRDV